MFGGLGMGDGGGSLPVLRVFGSPARTHFGRFFEVANRRLVGIGGREFDVAVEAYAQYGKGRHPAALNTGDCFAYACARANRATLLFTGEEFAKIDIPAAR